MKTIFKRGADLREFFARPDAMQKFHSKVTEVLQDGLYGADGLPVQRRRAIGGETLLAGGEILTVGQLTGLQPKAPVEVYRDDLPIDDQWKSVFRVVPSDGESESYTEADGAITFQALAVGEPPKLASFSGSLVTLTNQKVGARIGFDAAWIRDSKVYRVEDAVQEAKVAFADYLATYFYGLIKNASFSSTAYATDWVTSLNVAIAKLMRAGTLGPNQTPIVIAPVEKAGDMIQAVRDSMANARGTRIHIIPDFIFTRYYSSTTAIDVVAPKRHFIDQERESLRTETEKHAAQDFEEMAWYARFAGLVRKTTVGQRITY